jgi:hypothetical protein
MAKSFKESSLSDKRMLLVSDLEILSGLISFIADVINAIMPLGKVKEMTMDFSTDKLVEIYGAEMTELSNYLTNDPTTMFDALNPESEPETSLEPVFNMANVLLGDNQEHSMTMEEVLLNKTVTGSNSQSVTDASLQQIKEQLQFELSKSLEILTSLLFEFEVRLDIESVINEYEENRQNLIEVILNRYQK